MGGWFFVMRWLYFLVGVLFMQGVILGVSYAYHLRDSLAGEYSEVSEYFKNDLTESFEAIVDNIPDELRSFKDTEKLLSIYKVSNMDWERLLNLYAGIGVLTSYRVFSLILLFWCACVVLYFLFTAGVLKQKTYDVCDVILGAILASSVMMVGCFLGYFVIGVALYMRGAWLLNLL